MVPSQRHTQPCWSSQVSQHQLEQTLLHQHLRVIKSCAIGSSIAYLCPNSNNSLWHFRIFNLSSLSLRSGRVGRVGWSGKNSPSSVIDISSNSYMSGGHSKLRTRKLELISSRGSQWSLKCGPLSTQSNGVNMTSGLSLGFEENLLSRQRWAVT